MIMRFAKRLQIGRAQIHLLTLIDYSERENETQKHTLQLTIMTMFELCCSCSVAKEKFEYLELEFLVGGGGLNTEYGIQNIDQRSQSFDFRYLGFPLFIC